MISRSCSILILILLTTTCSNKANKQIPEPCFIDNLPVITSIDQMTLLTESLWVYAYSFNQDSCFVLNHDIIPVSYFFFECDPMVFKSQLPVPFNSLPLSKFCFRVIEKQEELSDSTYYTIPYLGNKNLSVSYFGKYAKNEFYINKISIDTLVVEFTTIFESPDGERVKMPQQVYLRKQFGQ